MTKEELLQKIKDDVANERDYKDWASMMKWYIHKNLLFMLTLAYEKVIERFAIAMCEEQKKECSKSAMIHIVSECGCKGIICSPSVCATLDYKSIEKCKNVAE